MRTNWLTVEQLQSVVGGVSYRPGWRFTITNDPYEGPRLRIVAEVVDSDDLATTTTLGVNSSVPPMASVGAFLVWLAWRLRRIESHECREFLRYQGERVSDPHQDR